MRAVDRHFSIIVAAAVAGERAPKNKPLGPLEYDYVAKLAAMGNIRIEIFDRNWRVFTILEGEHKGKQTAPPPEDYGRQPWMIIDKNGKRNAE